MNLAPYEWIDATDASKITYDPGTLRVSAYTTKGSRGGSWAQASGSAQPLLDSFDGKPALWFDGASAAKYLTRSAPAGGIPFATVYGVGQVVGNGYPGGENSWIAIGNYGSGINAHFGTFFNFGPTFLLAGSGETTARTNSFTWTNVVKRFGWRANPNNGATPLGGPPPTCLMDGASHTFNLGYSGSHAGSSSIGGTSAWGIGASANTLFRSNVKIRHLFVFTSLLSDTDLLALDAWAAVN